MPRGVIGEQVPADQHGDQDENDQKERRFDLIGWRLDALCLSALIGFAAIVRFCRWST